MDGKKLTEEQREAILEYAKWYDSYFASPEELLQQFEESLETPTKEEEPEYESFSI